MSLDIKVYRNANETLELTLEDIPAGQTVSDAFFAVTDSDDVELFYSTITPLETTEGVVINNAETNSAVLRFKFSPDDFANISVIGLMKYGVMAKLSNGEIRASDFNGVFYLLDTGVTPQIS